MLASLAVTLLALHVAAAAAGAPTAQRLPVAGRTLTVGATLGAPTGLRLEVPVGPVDIVGQAGLLPSLLQGRRGVVAALGLGAAVDVTLPVALVPTGALRVDAYGGLGAQVGLGGVGAIDGTDLAPPFPHLAVRLPVGVRLCWPGAATNVVVELAPVVPFTVPGILGQAVVGVLYRL